MIKKQFIKGGATLNGTVTQGVTRAAQVTGLSFGGIVDIGLMTVEFSKSNTYDFVQVQNESGTNISTPSIVAGKATIQNVKGAVFVRVGANNGVTITYTLNNVKFV